MPCARSSARADAPCNCAVEGGSGFSVQSLGVRVKGLGFTVLSIGCRVESSGFKVLASGFSVRQGQEAAEAFKVWGKGFGGKVLVFRVGLNIKGSGFRACG